MATVQMILRTVLGGYAGELTDRQKNFLESADRKCGQALDTVHDLMVLAEVTDRGAGSAVADLMSAVREVCDRHRSVAQDKKVELVCECPNESAFVRAAPTALMEAVTALLDNATKYTPEGGRIVVRVSRDDEGAVRLRVADSGIGVPEAEMERLFEPFFRATNARKLVQSGTGLGLAFVRAMARAAGGDVTARRSDLGGAEFLLKMPLAPVPSGQRRAEPPAEPSFRAVVIGGVAAGPKVASKIMRLQPDAHVTVVEMGQVLSYAGCGLPYYISGMVRDQRDLISTRRGAGPRARILRERQERARDEPTRRRCSIDREQRRVPVRDLIAGQEQWLQYDKLAARHGRAAHRAATCPACTCATSSRCTAWSEAEGIKAELAEGEAKRRGHRRRRADRRGGDRGPGGARAAA